MRTSENIIWQVPSLGFFSALISLKVSFLGLAIFLTLFLSACGEKSLTVRDVTETRTKKEVVNWWDEEREIDVTVKVSFPKISGLRDKRFEEEVNRLIKGTAEQLIVSENVSECNVSYEIINQPSKKTAILSILLTSYSEGEGNYGNHSMQLLNVDVKNKKIRENSADEWNIGESHIPVINQAIKRYQDLNKLFGSAEIKETGYGLKLGFLEFGMKNDSITMVFWWDVGPRAETHYAVIPFMPNKGTTTKTDFFSGIMALFKGLKYEQKIPALDGTFIVSKSGKWGVIDRKGMEIIALDYDSIFVNGDNFFVEKDGKTGWFHSSGAIVQEANLDSISHIGDLIICYEKNNAYLSSITGKKFYNDLFINIKKTYNPDYILVQSNKKYWGVFCWGVLNLKSNQITIPCTNVNVEAYPEGLFVFPYYGTPQFTDYQGKRINIPKAMVEKYSDDVDFSCIGKEIEKERVVLGVQQGNALQFQYDNGRSGMAVNNIIAVPPAFETINFNRTDRYCVVTRMGEYGLVELGKSAFVFPCRYKYIEVLFPFVTLTNHNGKKEVRNLQTGGVYNF